MLYIATTLAAICSCVALVSAQDESTNATIPMMSLGSFRRSGLLDAMESQEKYFDLMLQNFRSAGVQTQIDINAETDPRLTLLGGASITQMERSDFPNMLPHAGCNPYDQVISIPNDKPNVLLYPSCVVLKQCGGCCGHPDLMCKPTTTETKTVQVTKYVYDGQQAHPVERVDYIEVEEHTACNCQCKITEADCNPDLHKFDDWDCKCLCRQPQQSCPVGMRWDDNICACRCSAVQNCGTGYRYNPSTCSCDAMNERSSDSGSSSSTSGGNTAAADTRIEVVEVQETYPCPTLTCAKRYVASDVSGTCKCKFDPQEWSRRRAGK